MFFLFFFFQTELLYWPRPIVAFPWDQHDPSWLCNLFLWMHLSANITAAKSGLSYGHFTFRSTSHTHWSCKLCYVQAGSICWTNLLSFILGNLSLIFLVCKHNQVMQIHTTYQFQKLNRQLMLILIQIILWCFPIFRQ